MTKGELVMVVDDERTLVKALKFNLEKRVTGSRRHTTGKKRCKKYLT